MAPTSKQVVLVLLALFVQLTQHTRAQPIPTQYSNIQRSCPPGWVVLGFRGGFGYSCVLDPCYGTNSPCGPGNTCTTIDVYPSSIHSNCTCNPPFKSGYVSYPVPGYQTCYQSGQDACNPNPCANGGLCSYVTDQNGNPYTDADGTKYAFTCNCANTGFTGGTCSTPVHPIPGVTASVNGVTGPLARAVPDNICGANSLPPIACIYADNAHFLCCNDTSNCGPLGPDGVPVCPGPGYIRTPNNYPVSTLPPSPVPGNPSPPPPSGDQGVCGSGAASSFPTRCYFNSDPQGRYVCCDSDGCNGFNADNLFPHCKTNGYVPPNYGLSGPTPPSSPPSTPPSSPPSTPPTWDQGVCGSGAATDFPTRCYFNSDPLGRYVCCDNQGCDGFNSDNLTPHCARFGYVPPNNGLSGAAPPSGPPSSPPSSPPSGDQGVCGSGDATYFPNRCWFNSDPQGRYVCCDKDGCNGFNPPDYLFPRCQTNGYVPPNFGV